MHMADALLSPAVGGGMWAVTAGLIGVSSRKMRLEFQESRIPLMGVTGAFVFAAQMINFTIPATDSSGHIGGGLLLAILLGPWAGFLVTASVLVIQALFFADGGLLALGCNVFNLGFWTCFIAYPFIYKPIAGSKLRRGRIFLGCLLGAVVGLQLGAFSVVLETTLSGITDLPFGTFLLAMQPIHLAIGIVEGLVTAAVVLFVYEARPQVLSMQEQSGSSKLSAGFIAMVLLVAAIFIGGALSLLASEHPDGLEWSMSKTAGTEELDTPEGIHESLARVQEKTAILPDYGYKVNDELQDPAVTGTTVSGLAGAFLTLIIASGIGFLLKMRTRKILNTNSCG